MKISHELPLSLLKYGYEWNNYDYCLPIFMEKYKEYYDYFIQARKDERFILLDNSLFEGYIHTDSYLIENIELLQPDIFIVPDEWNNSKATIKNAKKWINEYKNDLPLRTNLMAVCQGKTYKELQNIYQAFVDLGYTHIAINHSSEAYTKIYKDPKLKLELQMTGRTYFIQSLVENNIIKYDYYHHLLGASDWREFYVYEGCKFIKSVDTSAPIINGALGIGFNYGGVYEKPKEKLEYFMEMDLTDKLKTIEYNVYKFKRLIQ